MQYPIPISESATNRPRLSSTQQRARCRGACRNTLYHYNAPSSYRPLYSFVHYMDCDCIIYEAPALFAAYYETSAQKGFQHVA